MNAHTNTPPPQNMTTESMQPMRKEYPTCKNTPPENPPSRLTRCNSPNAALDASTAIKRPFLPVPVFPSTKGKMTPRNANSSNSPTPMHCSANAAISPALPVTAAVPCASATTGKLLTATTSAGRATRSALQLPRAASVLRMPIWKASSSMTPEKRMRRMPSPK